MTVAERNIDRYAALLKAGGVAAHVVTDEPIPRIHVTGSGKAAASLDCGPRSLEPATMDYVAECEAALVCHAMMPIDRDSAYRVIRARIAPILEAEAAARRALPPRDYAGLPDNVPEFRYRIRYRPNPREYGYDAPERVIAVGPDEAAAQDMVEHLRTQQHVVVPQADNSAETMWFLDARAEWIDSADLTPHSAWDERDGTARDLQMMDCAVTEGRSVEVWRDAGRHVVTMPCDAHESAILASALWFLERIGLAAGRDRMVANTRELRMRLRDHASAAAGRAKRARVSAATGLPAARRGKKT